MIRMNINLTIWMTIEFLIYKFLSTLLSIKYYFIETLANIKHQATIVIFGKHFCNRIKEILRYYSHELLSRFNFIFIHINIHFPQFLIILVHKPLIVSDFTFQKLERWECTWWLILRLVCKKTYKCKWAKWEIPFKFDNVSSHMMESWDTVWHFVLAYDDQVEHRLVVEILAHRL